MLALIPGLRFKLFRNCYSELALGFLESYPCGISVRVTVEIQFNADFGKPCYSPGVEGLRFKLDC